MLNKMNFILCFLLITCLRLCFADQAANLTGKYSKCLRPSQSTKFSLDGLTNCTCVNGYEYDEVFGGCFKNKCQEICGEMSCSILKHGPNDFEYYCYCDPGFTRVDPYEAAGCLPIDRTFSKLIESLKSTKIALPINPFLAEQLNCSQTYVLTPKGYECRCFNGYRMLETGECRKVGSYVNYCKENQILALDEFDQMVCKCKPGFGGIQCQHNFCHWPTSSAEESEYLKKSIEAFCGVPTCRLAYNIFKCSCPAPFSKESKEGKCVLIEDCSENQNHDKCPKDKLCKINIKSGEERTFNCRCPIELADREDDEENCKKIEEPERCLPGYLPNPEIKREYRQKCIKGQSTFNLTFQMRFEMVAGNNSEIFLENYFELEQDLNLDKVPVNLIKQFVNYKDRTLIYTMDRVMNRTLVEKKMSSILEDTFRAQMNQIHFISCHYSVKVDFDDETFSLVRIDETLVNVHLTVTCLNHTQGDLFESFFKFNLRENHLNSNYQKFCDVGNVISDSIIYHQDF